MAVICESHAACRSYLNAQALKNATRRPPILMAQTPQFWSPPTNGVVKINVDASWKPELHKADCTIEAKTLAILEGCNFAIQQGHTRVVIEFDSKEAISCPNRSIPRGRWQLYPIFVTSGTLALPFGIVTGHG
ncbi:unnamed protein product [Prunus armeniaca]|uniref:RNase H type-1 domain-containing protein n=1 Tax=Prunus armeniaca TaxID=36596 RepID=A0A6J5XDR8_PRUAR|nr:unnamed protein product [Prunus armeniaca]CAB4310065.1 unnamed protein product [Prunus armeniaca]